MVVQFSIVASNADDLIGLGFTTAEVWQSLDDSNSYQEITASSPQAAFLESNPALNTFRVGGSELRFIIDQGVEKTVTFSTIVMQWTPQQVVDRINEIAPGVASLDSNVVKLTSSTTGRSSSVQVTYNDSPDLWFPSDVAYGRSARVPLVSGTYVYNYTDVAGTLTARYRWRFSNNGAAPISGFYAYVLGSALPLVNVSALSVCSATFMGLDGTPLKTRLVIVAEDNPSNLSGFVASNRGPLIFDSDASGFVQFTLLRGAKVRVAIEGTTFVREITVPDAATFDLLTLMTDAPDPFTVQVPPPFLIRRNI